MESRRFDQLTTSLSTRLSRRTALAGAAGLTALGLARVPPDVTAQEATPVAGEAEGANKTAFLFVQLFDEGTWVPKPDEDGVYLLTLTGASAQTLFFSDRPARIVGTVDTPQFLETLGFTPVNPPNAALVVRTPEGERDVLVIELFNPVYTEDINDPGNVTVAYEARVLEAYQGDGLEEWATAQEDAELPAQFSDISLFIDDCPDLNGCYHWSSGARIGNLPRGPVGNVGTCSAAANQITPTATDRHSRTFMIAANAHYGIDKCGGSCRVWALGRPGLVVRPVWSRPLAASARRVGGGDRTADRIAGTLHRQTPTGSRPTN